MFHYDAASGPPPQARGNFWPVAAEWAGMTALACLIVTMGPVVGYLSAKSEMDAESRAFAETALRAVASSWNSAALMARASPEFVNEADAHAAALRPLKGETATGEACLGRTQLAPFSKEGLITAHYLCGLR